MARFKVQDLSPKWRHNSAHSTCARCGGPMPAHLIGVWPYCRSRCNEVRSYDAKGPWSEERVCCEEGCETKFTAKSPSKSVAQSASTSALETSTKLGPTGDPIVTMLYDPDERKIGCVLLQAVAHCNWSLPYKWAPELWLDQLTPGLRRLQAPRSLWEELAEMDEEYHRDRKH